MPCHLSCVVVLTLEVCLRLVIIQPLGHFVAFWHCQPLWSCHLETHYFSAVDNLAVSEARENYLK